MLEWVGESNQSRLAFLTRKDTHLFLCLLILILWREIPCRRAAYLMPCRCLFLQFQFLPCFNMKVEWDIAFCLCSCHLLFCITWLPHTLLHPWWGTLVLHAEHPIIAFQRWGIAKEEGKKKKKTLPFKFWLWLMVELKSFWIESLNVIIHVCKH